MNTYMEHTKVGEFICIRMWLVLLIVVVVVVVKN